MRVFKLIWKELLIVLKDPRSRISIILPPIIQLVIFAYAATLDVKNATIGVLNRDNGEQAIELLQRFIGSPLFKNIVYLRAVEEIPSFLDEQKGLMVVSIDEQFSRNLDAGKKGAVQLLCDGRKSNTTQLLSGYATEIVQDYNRDYTAKARIKQQNAVIVPRTWFNPNIIYLWYNIPCLVGTLSMLTCLVVTSQSVAREREMGTFDQLLVSPLSLIEILVGKIVPGILIGAGEGILMWTAGTLFLGVPFTGSIVLFLLSLALFVTAISGVGLFISSLSATQQQAMLGTFVFMLPSVLLAGYATPIENMPHWLQPFTFLLPLRYMLILCKGLFLKNISAAFVFDQLWPMALIACGTLTLATLYFRRRIQ
ncbi:MAG: ABC transporter permease [Verrucomicrobiota bacterium]|nr:ABC transporter permease [Verrucomicrobiota bacterium]